MTEFSTPEPTKSTPYEPRSLEEKEEAFRLAAILAEEIQKMKESGQIPDPDKPLSKTPPAR